MEPGDFSQVFDGFPSAVFNAGFLAWFAWYMVTKIIPKFNETIKEVQREFREELRLERSEYRADVARFWDQHTMKLDNLSSSFDRLTDELRQERLQKNKRTPPQDRFPNGESP